METTDQLPLGDEKYSMVQSMFDDIAPTYEKANTFMTFGFDKRIRNKALKELRCKPGEKVLDLASGTGDFSRMLSLEDLVPISCDFSMGMLANSHGDFDRVQGDGTRLPFADNSFSGVTCGYALRNFVDLSSVFQEVMRVIRPGGHFVAVDVSVPSNRIIRFGNKLWFSYCVPKIGYLISKNKQAYDYLPRSRSYLPSYDELKRLLVECGGTNVRVDPLMGGSVVLIVATKADDV